jgi:hypothetical protein
VATLPLRPQHPTSTRAWTVAVLLAVAYLVAAVADALTTALGLAAFPEILTEQNPLIAALIHDYGLTAAMVWRVAAAVPVVVTLLVTARRGYLVRSPRTRAMRVLLACTTDAEIAARRRRRFATWSLGAGAVVTWTVAAMNAGGILALAGVA